MPVHHFDMATLAATPWKNGDGTTREIVCQPPGAGLDAFDWRVSIASIVQAGPFSVFPQIDRVIMLLDGEGVHLRSPAAGIDHALDTVNVPFAFPGDVALDCTLLGGPSTDLNVMTRRSSLRAKVQVLHAATVIPATQGGLLLALHGDWQLHDGSCMQACAAGQGLWWWSNATHDWQATPQQDDAALIWVSLNTVGA